MGKHLSLENGSVFYKLKGNGPSVVFLHGFLEDHSIWDYFVKKLSANYQVLAVDLPGSGKSSVFDTIHTMEFMAETVNLILEKEKITEYILVGHSMGGYVALELAEKYPEKLNGIVLFHSHASADDEQGKINRNRTIEVVKKNHKDFINSFIPLLFAEKNLQLYSKEIANLQEIASKTSAEGIIASLGGMRDRKDRTAMLAQLDEPVFFILGKNDSRIQIDKTVAQISIPKNCEALILDGVGHMGFIEAHETTFLALEHFIERDFYLHTLNKRKIY
jgi:pimeloyl-ACP methyl ester carboxylesterase